MVVIKVIRHSGSGVDYLQNMCNYVTDSRAIARGGFGVNAYDAESAFSQMLAVREHYNQLSTNPLVHIIVSFDGSCDDEAFAIQTAPLIASFFAAEYQVMWCVHRADAYDAHYHIHILLHTVNLLNGKLFHSGPYEINGFGYHVKSITNRPFQIYFDCIKD